MNDLFEEISDAVGDSKEAAKAQIDDEAKDFKSRIIKGIPVKTGGLKGSFTFEKQNKEKDYYGYSSGFAGESPTGEPYEKIANVLNYGRKERKGTFAGTFFVSKAVRKLKGMDARIAARIDAHLKKRT